jgi:hypothetical protein
MEFDKTHEILHISGRDVRPKCQIKSINQYILLWMYTWYVHNILIKPIYLNNLNLFYK